MSPASDGCAADEVGVEVKAAKRGANRAVSSVAVSDRMKPPVP
ncbi:hypothetical protein [Aurantimonas manganoxydans]|nr:hypothetical protein [Aurantimonas manganoxydans]MCW7544180.1 hypothetical protein [Aurantimonas litoralis]MDX1730687.1 hypothetical protein [Aurantimonas coralicida]